MESTAVCQPWYKFMAPTGGTQARSLLSGNSHSSLHRWGHRGPHRTPPREAGRKARWLGPHTPGRPSHSQGPSGSDSNTWHLPSGKRPPLPLWDGSPLPVAARWPSRAGVVGAEWGCWETVHWRQPRCLCGARSGSLLFSLQLVSRKGKTYTRTTPDSPLAVSFQRNPRLRKDLIKHLLNSLSLHGI